MRPAIRFLFLNTFFVGTLTQLNHYLNVAVTTVGALLVLKQPFDGTCETLYPLLVLLWRLRCHLLRKLGLHLHDRRP